MLNPRRVLAIIAFTAILLLIFHKLPDQEFRLPSGLNFTLHIPDLEPTSRPVLVPTIVGAAVPLYSPPGMQTYPRAVKLHSGTLLAVLAAFEPENTISLSISRDDGASWVPYSTVATAPTSNVQLNNAFLLEMPNMRILCAFRSHTLKPEAVGAEEKPGGANEGYLYYKLMIYFSDDIGKTWNYLSTPVQEQGPTHGLWEPFLRLSNKGELQFYYSREEGGRDQDNLIRTSHDGGLTWSSHSIVSGQNLVARDGMAGIQELEPKSGVLIAVFESVEEKGAEGSFEARFAVWSATSRDDGKTWGERRIIYESFWNEPKEHALRRNAGAPQIALVGQTLAISFMTDEERLEGTWHRNAFIKIITSDDGGETWGNKMVVADMPAAWAGLLVLNDTDFLVLCEHNDRVEATHMKLVAKRSRLLGG